MNETKNEQNLTVENPELKATLEALRLKESPELENTAYEMISNTTKFLSVVNFADDFTPENPKYDFPVLTTTGHGYMFYPVFTDMEEVHKYTNDKDLHTLTLSFDDYASMMEEHPEAKGIVINPYSVNFSLERDMIDFLKVQKAFIGKLAIEQMFQKEENSGLTFSAPDPYPTEMTEALHTYFSTNENIDRVWLRLMNNSGEISYLLVIDAKDSETNCDFGEISSVALPYTNGNYLDLVNLGDELGQLAIKDTEPFYTRA